MESLESLIEMDPSSKARCDSRGLSVSFRNLIRKSGANMSAGLEIVKDNNTIDAA